MPAIVHAECALGELGGHAQKASDDQPERRARTTQRNSNGDTGNITNAHSPGNCRRQGLKSGYLPTCVTSSLSTTQDNTQALSEPRQIDETKIDGKENTTSDQPRDDQRNLGVTQLDTEKDETGYSVRSGPQQLVDNLVDDGNPLNEKDYRTLLNHVLS